MNKQQTLFYLKNALLLAILIISGYLLFKPNLSNTDETGERIWDAKNIIMTIIYIINVLLFFVSIGISFKSLNRSGDYNYNPVNSGFRRFIPKNKWTRSAGPMRRR